MSAGSTAAAVEPVPAELVSLAHDLADAAAGVSRRYFRTPVSVDVKSDSSPVTIADREAEAAMRQLIASRCPDHAIFGEEQGFLAGGPDSEYLWVIDPIDGTKSFITGGWVGGWVDLFAVGAAAARGCGQAHQHMDGNTATAPAASQPAAAQPPPTLPLHPDSCISTPPHPPRPPCATRQASRCLARS